MNFLSEGCNLSDVLGDQLRMDKVSRESWGACQGQEGERSGALATEEAWSPKRACTC